MIIFGAGLAGCIAGALNDKSVILEPQGNKTTHQALMRFRTPYIGEAIGIPFKKIKVYKGIWHNDKPVELSPRYIALYSRKVSDSIAYRSICNLETTERWIAPIDFHDQLKDQLEDKITYNVDIKNTIDLSQISGIISTIPINILAELYGYTFPDISMNMSSIKVTKYKVPDCDVSMTYYYTDPTINVYRASINGDELIMESMWDITKEEEKVVMRSFGLTGVIVKPIMKNFIQKNGKMRPIDNHIRKEFIYNMTLNHNVYSLGRFATWRNIVMDDVFKDIHRIKGWMNKSHYDRIIGE